jgi:hypothetical protein
MAIMRCRAHAPHGRAREYVAAVEPVGFPNSALVCGSKHCKEPAFIWLEGAEKVDYDSGVRVFRCFTDTMKVRAA